jgi:1,4-alpha-glucan branching enzyme
MASLKKNKKRDLSSSTIITEMQKEVEFTFHDPKAQSVSLAGSFNDWNTESLPMTKEKSGTWKTKIMLQQGAYEYKYFVDGNWAQELPCEDVGMNPYGTCNCMLAVS